MERTRRSCHHYAEGLRTYTHLQTHKRLQVSQISLSRATMLTMLTTKLRKIEEYLKGIKRIM